MPRYSRLSPLGVTGRLFPVIIAATGTLACGATLSGTSSLAGSAGSVSATTTWTGVGSSVASATGSILARGLFDAGVGHSVRAASGTIAGQAQFIGSSGGHFGRLSPLGVTGRFYSPVPKASSVPRLWNVSETFGLSIAITDFTERVFYLADSFGLALNTTVYLSGTGGNFNATTTWTGVSGAIAAPTATLAAMSTWTGVGQGVVVNSGAGSLPISVDFAGQGSTAGTVFGLGVGLLQESTIFSGVGNSRYEAQGSLISSAAVVGVGTPLFAGIGSLPSASVWSGNSTTFSPAAGSISISATFSGIALSNWASAGNMQVGMAFNGQAIQTLSSLTSMIRRRGIRAASKDNRVRVQSTKRRVKGAQK